MVRQIEPKKIKILGIETSCDETSAAVLEGGCFVLSNVIHSQIATHRVYGGVVPEIAARDHVGRIDEVVVRALQDARCKMQDISAIAVTYGPGLVGALLVGVNFAKALAYSVGLPLVAVNHLEGHIASSYLENPDWKPPFVALITSGGHCHLVHVRDYTDFEILGRTHDDAAGEAFDKVARTLGLPYPGGVEIDRLARTGDPAAIAFPRPKLTEGLDFSFSGLKSAVLNYLNSAKMSGAEINPANIAASFQEAVVDTLTEKALKACKQTASARLAVVGGVACNSRLRALLTEKCAENNIRLNIPKPIYCTDNAAMIAAAAHPHFKAGNFAALSLNASPSLNFVIQ
ncbi:MAG: tRNA (adenosine(37)-N6)-threonylcarbamoyltransferase complex transferase subunit TsaD [Defluviitaleaceae bacterium]|nr:tRNA (adenosine(37)-N6)-threonylcarbamoyltransferase complex transferase subunit TsaD [Defluviitaleaceae bacterium]